MVHFEFAHSSNLVNFLSFQIPENLSLNYLRFPFYYKLLNKMIDESIQGLNGKVAYSFKCRYRGKN